MIHLKINHKQLSEYLSMLRKRSQKEKVYKRIYSVLEKLQNYLTKKVKSDYLSGQSLHRRTGKLSRSIKSGIIYTDTTGRIFAPVGSYACEYAAIHEYGGIQKRHGKRVGNYVIRFPERSYLRKALEDNQDKINDNLYKDMSKIWKEIISGEST